MEVNVAPGFAWSAIVAETFCHQRWEFETAT